MYSSNTKKGTREMNIVSINPKPTLVELQQKLLDVIASEPFANISIAETLGVLEMVKFILIREIEEL
jgi:hypothetical protein